MLTVCRDLLPALAPLILSRPACLPPPSLPPVIEFPIVSVDTLVDQSPIKGTPSFSSLRLRQVSGLRTIIGNHANIQRKHDQFFGHLF